MKLSCLGLPYLTHNMGYFHIYRMEGSYCLNNVVNSFQQILFIRAAIKTDILQS